MVPEGDTSYPRREPAPLPAYPDAGRGARSSRPPRPPLTKRMRRGHWIAIDCVVACVAALCDAAIVSHGAGPGAVGAPAVLLLLLAVGVFVPVALRRLAPVAAFGALVILAVLVADVALIAPVLIFLAAAYVLYIVTATSNRQTGAAALGLALVVILLIAVVVHGIRSGGAGVLVIDALALVSCWIAGYSVRQRRLYAQMLQEQATSSAVAEERLRIARELHDVVAHSMSVIAVQAGYGQYVIDSSPAGAREALGAIQATSREALEEMRRMLGVLRQQDAAAAPAPAGARAPTAMSAPLAPAPGLARLGRLIERTRGAGVQVSLESSGQVKAVPAGVDLSAYRIIQEALTNVVKHAGGGARCVISLDYGEQALHIRVTDGGGALVPSPAGPRALGVPVGGTGHGIIGMRERASLCGGDFTAGALPGDGFEVTATLPLLGVPAAADGSPGAGAGGLP